MKPIDLGQPMYRNPLSERHHGLVYSVLPVFNKNLNEDATRVHSLQSSLQVSFEFGIALPHGDTRWTRLI